jgi:methylthioribose-1-phosphate isomerase
MSGASRYQPPEQIRWSEVGDSVVILDQTELPARRVEKELRTVADVEEAIQSLRVRGAPLIGITAAMGIGALARQAVREAGTAGDELKVDALRECVRGWCDRLEQARPTAVNLVWAIKRLRGAVGIAQASDGVADAAVGPPGIPAIGSAADLADRLRAEADEILEEDRRMCRGIGEHAAEMGAPSSPTATRARWPLGGSARRWLRSTWPPSRGRR